MKPFDLYKALAGDPVKLRNGKKALVVNKVPTYIDANNPLIGYVVNKEHDKIEPITWTSEGSFHSQSIIDAFDIIGMWEDPRIINGIEVPRAVTLDTVENAQLYYFISLISKELVSQMGVDTFNEHCREAIKRGLVFKTKEDAQKMAKALLNYKEGKKIEWFNANEKQPELDSKILYYSIENGIGIGIVKEINYDFIDNDDKPYKLLLIYDVNDETEFITSAEYWIPVPQPPQA
ncbi:MULTISPECIES: hypothetical protein [Gallibacterium]|uniref:hypothetical protein n=1 Tax=Gallibacterium TaxID=155493 RepID=UPI000691047A|nr:MULTISPECIES: hypothetical protein [Gallibacterium]